MYFGIGTGISILAHRLAVARNDAQQRELEFNSLVRLTPIGIGIAEDPECRRIRVNPAMAAMLRIGVNDNASLTAPPEQRPSFKIFKDGVPVAAEDLPLQKAARLGTEVRDVELDVLHDDGSRVSLYRSAMPLFDDEGKTRGAIGAFLDISEIRRSEKALTQALEQNAELYRQAQAAHQLKDQFLATLSHELRTPLNALLGWIQLLRSGNLSEAKRQRALDAIARSAELQARLTADLLDVSAAMTGKLRLDKYPVDLASLVNGVIESFRPSADAKNIRIQSSIDRPLPAVTLDPSRMDQVISNLVSNAIKFTPAGGGIRVNLSARDSELVITVADTGIGIPGEFLPHVFDHFRQADDGTTREHAGLGLGLAIVRHLVALHGGAVTVESAGQDRGATFTVRMPIAQRTVLAGS